MKLISIDSTKPLARIREDLERACAAHKFGVLGVHDLRAKMREKGVAYGRESLVFEVCNPQQAKRVLEANPGIAAALPCRIAVYEDADGTTRVATIRPSTLLDLFDTPGACDVAREVEETMKAILREAAG